VSWQEIMQNFLPDSCIDRKQQFTHLYSADSADALNFKLKKDIEMICLNLPITAEDVFKSLSNEDIDDLNSGEVSVKELTTYIWRLVDQKSKG